MDKFDLTQALVAQGVDEHAANRLKGQINGNDLMNLISNLKIHAFDKAGQILGKYGIKLGAKKTMGDNFLGAKFESLRSGAALDETFGVMTRVSEGFSYAVEVSEQNRDRVLDWLDENQVEYQATSPTNYHIECGDREGAYRTGRALSEILRKPTVRDSVETEVSEMAKKKSTDRRVKDAQAKMADMKPRNPVVAAVKTRASGAHDGGKDPRKVDKLGRDRKHKTRYDEEIDFAIGEDVNVGGITGQVKIPHGPNGTIGVIMNGQLEMVSETEVSRLDEGVIGMNKVNPLFRLRELAGLPQMAEDDFSGIEIADAPEIDPEGVLAAGPVGADAPADMDVDGMGADPVADPMDDMDGGMDTGMDDMGMDAGADMGMDAPADTIPDIDDETMPDTDLDVSGMVDPQAGVPGAIGSDPVDAVPGLGMDNGMGMAPSQSDAMAQIEDALNSIQTGLADIRLSEYKSLIKKLQDLTNQAQMMGRDYLGERRKK